MDFFWWLLQMVLFASGAAFIAVYLGGEKIDGAILFLLFIVGFRVSELHAKVDKLVESNDDDPIK
jgi:uncharacterized membrane protein YjjP (DUF1212 family)